MKLDKLLIYVGGAALLWWMLKQQEQPVGDFWTGEQTPPTDYYDEGSEALTTQELIDMGVPVGDNP